MTLLRAAPFLTFGKMSQNQPSWHLLIVLPLPTTMMIRHVAAAMLLALLLAPTLNAWTLLFRPLSPRLRPSVGTAMFATPKKKRTKTKTDNFLDAEIVPDSAATKMTAAATTGVVGRSGGGGRGGGDKQIKTQDDMTLLQLSLEQYSAEEFKKTRIPFMDLAGQAKIDVRLALMADIDGVQYGIGVPFDAAAAIVIERPSPANDPRAASTVMGDPKTLNFVSPDDNDNEELMAIMATQLCEQVNPDLRLLRTPRVLTIKGPIDEVTGRWKDQLLPEPVPVQKLIDPFEGDEAKDDGASFFLDFMRNELGEATFNKVMAQDPDPELMTDELMELFNIPSEEEMAKEMYEPENLERYIDEEFGNIDRDVAALRLVAYFFKGGQSYSLVKLLTPFPLVAKFVEGRFEFLQKQEEELVIPRLEELYRDDLQNAGLELNA
jgi:hypothetical protein